MIPAAASDFRPPTEEEIVDILRAHPLIRLKEKVRRAFLVGSFATQSARDDSDVDILLEVVPREDEDAHAMEERYRQKLRQHFVKHNIKGKDDSVHPQWMNRRVDLYFTYDAAADHRNQPRPRIELVSRHDLLAHNGPMLLAAYSCDHEDVAPGRWAGRVLFHGASEEGARDLLREGVDNSRSGGGYFGPGFYMACNAALAKSNYADLSGEDGAVVAVRIKPGANILDLRREEDAYRFNAASRHGADVSKPGFDRIMREHGIDGLFDRSMEGVVIFDPMAVKILGIVAVGTPLPTKPGAQP
jgi:predicted nucleotidyltransferase